MTTFYKKCRALSPGAVVYLFDVDTTVIGGDNVYHFTDCTTANGTIVQFNGVAYPPIGAEFDGFDKISEGTIQTPSVSVDNQLLTFAGIVEDYNNLKHAKVTRRTTFAEFLDDQPTADATQQRVESYYVASVMWDNTQVMWRLKSLIDFQNKLLPKRQITSRCAHRYRYYQDGAFVYDNITCPYTGGSYFDADDAVVVNPEDDVCSKRPYACSLRYPGNDTVRPFDGFPGVGKISKVYR